MPCLADKGTDLIKSVQTLFSSLHLFFFIMLLMKFLSFIAGSLTSAAGGKGGRCRRRGNRSNSQSKVEAEEALTSRIVINSAFEHSVHCATHDKTGRGRDVERM